MIPFHRLGSMNARLPLAVTLIVACGSGERDTDAGVRPSCATEPGPDRVCVPAGRFNWGTIVDLRAFCAGCGVPASDECESCLEAERLDLEGQGRLGRPMDVDEFVIDVREVSIGEYAE